MSDRRVNSEIMSSVRCAITSKEKCVTLFYLLKAIGFLSKIVIACVESPYQNDFSILLFFIAQFLSKFTI